MVNIECLNKKIDESGMTKSFIANAIGISRESLNNKITGKTEIKVSEAEKMIDLLRLSNEEVMNLFFCLEA